MTLRAFRLLLCLTLGLLSARPIVSQLAQAQTGSPPDALLYPAQIQPNPQLDAANSLLYPDYRRVHKVSLQRAARGQQEPCLTTVITGTPSYAWNAVALEVIREVKPAPPVVARALAILHTAMYDAWAPYTPGALTTTTLDKSRLPATEHTLANKRQAVSFAAYTALSDLFPAQKCRFEEALVQSGYTTSTLVVTSTTTPVGVGILAARRVLDMRHNDGSNQLNGYADTTGYVPVNAPLLITGTFAVTDVNRWQPLYTPSGTTQGGACDPFGAVKLQKHVVPQFGQVQPFALNDGALITPTRGPAVIPSADFDVQASELLSISRNLDDRMKSIAEYWADGPSSELPPGHWSLIAMFVSRRDAHSIDDDAKMFFAMTNATMDAGIQAWKIKRLYDNSRPITAMRWRYRNVNIAAWGGPGQGTTTIRGSAWLPYQQLCFVSPPFSEFVSGHSTFSAAAAEVLKRYTGSDAFGATIVISEGTSLAEPDFTPQSPITLTWPTFSAAADQAGLSRRYGGIHFREADLQGRVMGRSVGDRAWARAAFYFSNTVVYSNSVLLPQVSLGP
jgi:hypothetical protein